MFNELLKFVLNLVEKYTKKTTMNPMGHGMKKHMKNVTSCRPGHQTVWVKKLFNYPGAPGRPKEYDCLHWQSR